MLTIYSNTMVRQIKDFPLTATEATYAIGVSVFVGAMLAPLFTSKMTRRSNFLYGHGIMGPMMILMGIFVIYKIFMPVFVCMCLYAIFF